MPIVFRKTQIYQVTKSPCDLLRNGSRNRLVFVAASCRAPLLVRPCHFVLGPGSGSTYKTQAPRRVINTHSHIPSQQTCITRSDDLPVHTPTLPVAVTKEQLQQLFQKALDPSTPTHLPWSLEQLCSSLNTSQSSGQPNNEEQVNLQRARFGANSLPEAKAVTLWELVVEALQDFTLLMLIGAGALSLVLASVVPGAEAGDWIEGAAILASALVVVLVAAGTNMQKEIKFRELNSMCDDVEVRVVRGGRERSVNVKDVVVGDIVLVEGGDILPADGLLLPGGQLKLDESHLTGESDDVIKGSGLDGSVLEGDASPAMVFSGSKVLEGFGRALVLAVGESSQQGVIGGLVSGQDGPTGENLREDTLLVQKLDALAKDIGGFGVAAAAGVLVLNLGGLAWDLLRQGEALTAVNHLQEYLSCVMNAITVLVVAVPEGLPLAVTLALAFSVQRMLADKTLVRNLAACETMASATTVLSDKTGTLTENNMRVVRIWAGGCSYRVRPSATGRTSAPPTAPPLARLRPLLPAPAFNSANLRPLRGSPVIHRTNPMQSTSMSGTLSSISMISLSVDDDSMAGVAAAASATATAVLEPWPTAKSAGSNSTQPASTDNGPLWPDDCDCVEEAGSRSPVADASFLPLPRAVVDPLLMNVALNSTACVQIGKGSQGQLDAAGNRTECALLEFALRLDPSLQRVDSLRRRFNVLQVLPFTSQRKSMTTVVVPADALPGEDPPAEVFMKGAAEVVLKCCNWQVGASGQVVELPEGMKQQILDSFSREGLRVLALAYKPSPPQAGLGQLEEEVNSGMVLAGVVGLEDPLRPEVPHSIQQCKRAGITVRMLTGDNPVTAISIARKCGILPEGLDIDAALATSRAVHKEQGVVVGLPPTPPGQEPTPLAIEAPRLREMITNGRGKLDEMSLLALWPHLRVVARCTPSDKYLLVAGAKKLRSKGLLQEVVAVTGDGTNDAPALRAADVGFAMNSGTGIAKEAADILLMNDSFSSVVAAARWGRNVYAGISRFLQFQLTANVVAVATAALGAICLRDSPLSAVQMLWVNLIMDSLASLALATEPPTEELLDSPPVGVDQPLVSGAVTKHIAGQSALQLVLMAVLVLQGESLLSVDHATCHTLVFNTFVWLQLFNQINCRRVRDEPNPFQGVQHSPLFLTILSVEAVLQVLIVQYGGKAFSTVPLSPSLWAACISLGALSLAARAGLRLVPSDPIAQMMGRLNPASSTKPQH